MKRELIARFCIGVNVLALMPQSAFASAELEAKVKWMEAELQQLKALILQEQKQRECFT